MEIRVWLVARLLAPNVVWTLPVVTWAAHDASESLTTTMPC